MIEYLILAATFVSVLLFFILLANWIASRVELSSRVDEISRSDVANEPTLAQADISGIHHNDRLLIENYFNVVRKSGGSNVLQSRLIRAGFFSTTSPFIFQFIRFAVSFSVLLAAYFLAIYLFPDKDVKIIIVIAFFVSSAAFVIVNILLDRMGDKKEIYYRKLFPEFMDMLIVCLDAGLSVEAAMDRVSKEFLSIHKDFGIHLMIMMMEVRGGRRLRDALENFAARVQIDEAKSLATLLRQSEELGSSVTKTLRVYADEMRQMRIIRAEEKANTLPLKMLFPLAIFLFPMSILIVAIPIIMRVIAMLVMLGSR